jgi:hypothetical protein
MFLMEDIPKKLRNTIKKLKTCNNIASSSISSYYLLKPVVNEEKTYYALIFNDENNVHSEWIDIKKNKNYIITYSVELKIDCPQKVLIFLGIKNNDKLHIIKSSKNFKELNVLDNKLGYTLIYKPNVDEKICIILKIENSMFELSPDCIFSMFETF